MKKISNTISTTMKLPRVISVVVATAAVLLLTNGNGGDGNNLFVRGSENTPTTTVRRRRVLVQNVNQEVEGGSVKERERESGHTVVELDDGAELDFYDHDFRLLSSMSMDTIEMKQVYFTADTTPLGDGEVTSETTLFIPQWTGLSDVAAPNDVVCFVGSAQQLEADIESVYGGGSGTQCSAANGCGVHVHAGTSCEDTDTQGGHWYNTDTVSADPWATVGYLSTTADGDGQYASCVRTGYDLMSDPSLLEGHVFIVHGEDGARVSCGPIVPASPATNTIPIPHSAKFLTAETVPFPADEDGNGGGEGSGVVKVMSDLSESVMDGVCYMGWATGLTPNVVSFLVDGSNSEQCNVKNGCGAHIHEGPGCDSKDEQGSHYYDRDTIAADPFNLNMAGTSSYYTTDDAGTAALIGCVITGTGAADYQAKAFIVHSVAGDRLLCGLLE